MKKTLGFVLCVTAGCTASGGTGSGGADLGATSDLAMTATHDLAVVPDLSPPPDYGTRLAAGDFFFAGLTNDGFAIVQDGTSWSAIAVATGKATKIADYGAMDTAQVGHKTVFLYSGVDQSTGIGALTIWSSAGGAHAVAMSAVAGVAADSSDGSHVVYIDNAMSGSSTSGDLIADAPDHSAEKTLATQIDLGQCAPALAFAGGTVVVSHCAAGATSADVTAYDLTSGMGTTLASAGADFLTIDPARTRVIVADSNGVAKVITIGTSAAVTIAQDFASGVFSPDGTQVVYVSPTGALERVSAAGTPGTTMLQTMVAALDALSPDGKYVMYSQNQDQSTGFSDFYVAGTAQAGTATPLVADTSGALYGPPFTADGSYALAAKSVDSSLLIGELDAVAVGMGGKPAAIGQGVWVWQNAGAAKVAFTDNTNETQTDATADLEVLDLAAGTQAAKIAPNIRPDFAITSDDKSAVFAVAQDGLYLKALP